MDNTGPQHNYGATPPPWAQQPPQGYPQWGYPPQYYQQQPPLPQQPSEMVKMLKTVGVGAATTLLAGSVVAALNFYNEAGIKHEQLNALRAEYTEYRKETDAELSNYRDQVSALNLQISLLRDRQEANSLPPVGAQPGPTQQRR